MVKGFDLGWLLKLGYNYHLITNWEKNNSLSSQLFGCFFLKTTCSRTLSHTGRRRFLTTFQPWSMHVGANVLQPESGNCRWEGSFLKWCQLSEWRIWELNNLMWILILFSRRYPNCRKLIEESQNEVPKQELGNPQNSKLFAKMARNLLSALAITM